MKTFVFNLGNTSLFGGVFSGDQLRRQFRVPWHDVATEKEFARLVLARVRGSVERVAFCSVVPRATARVRGWVTQHFSVVPQLLTVEASHGLKIGYRRPKELGTDRLAAALGTVKLFSDKNVVIVDCGTATTVTALRRGRELLGGAILPGIGLWPAMLAARTAQLPNTPLARPRVALGRSTREGLQSGIQHGHAGAVRELVRRIRAEAFGRERAWVIGTGGYASTLVHENIFDQVVPDLVLRGLNEFAARVAVERL